MTQTADVVIIGGGAAGLHCAALAAQRGQRVVLIEHANRVGKKILMSGGGRCNFTNTGAGPANYLSGNPHFCKSALARYTPWHFIELVERHRIAYHEKELGQLFCDQSSKQIVAMLLQECADAGVEIRTQCSVQQVEHPQDRFKLMTSQGAFESGALVIASGGLSIPSMGASGWGYDLAKQFGHGILPLRAGLVPLTLSGKHQEHFAELSGVAFPVNAQTDTAQFCNAMLITHRGLSGPAVLQISSYWQPGEPLMLDLLPGQDALAMLQQARQERPSAELKTILSEWLPRRFAQRLCEVWLPNPPMRQIDAGELSRIAALLQSFPITASGTEGYRTAEVTLGGVDTHALSSQSMMSMRVSGLFFIGEVVDVTGWLGGYNFQWAWASASACANAL